ncbi:MAG: hypothetical protein ACU83U_12120 [Gammaproteobacteria bacterium]
MIGEQKTTAKANAPAAKPEAQAVAEEQPKPEIAVAKQKPTTAKAATPKPVATKTATPKPTAKANAAKASTPKPAAAKKATAPVAAAAKSTGLKDPKTAEITTSYSNYRFTKRWIKDALVAEGLLEKVYKNNELNAETEAKIKDAIGKLEAMDKYKA